MINLHILRPLVLFCLLLFISCEADKKNEELPVPQPGTAAHFYLLGLDSSDPEEKLRLYNSGLEAIRSKRDTTLVALLDGKVFSLFRLGQYEPSLVWIDSLINSAEFQNDLFYQAKGLHRKYWVKRLLGYPQEAFEHAYYSRELYLAMGDTAGAGRRSLDLANFQVSLGDNSGAQETATEALKYLDIELNQNYISSAHNVLGLTYNSQGLYEEALKEYGYALEYAINREDSLSYLHNIALAFKNQKKYDEAKNIFKEIVSAGEIDEKSQLRFRDNYAYTLWLQDPSKSVDKELLQVLERRLERNDREGIMTSYSHLSDYFLKKDSERSSQYAIKLLEAADQNKNPLVEASALKKLLFLNKGKAGEEYLDRYLFLSDSLRDAQLKLKYHFTKIRFDEERKQQQIALLESQNLTQSLKSERLKTGTVISSLSALLILITAGTLLFIFRQRNNREKIREIYNTESRISEKIHDELANDLYGLMSSAEHTAPELTDRLEKIYLRTRDISRENAAIPTGSDFFASLVTNLRINIPTDSKLIIRGEQSVTWNRVTNEKKQVLYRVLQELMINMKKHSKAKLVAIMFSVSGKTLKVTYSDTGRGIDFKNPGSGNGLKNMENRLKTINGSITYKSEPDQGFKADIIIKI